MSTPHSTILIVEDDESLRELIAYNLDLEGREVLECANGFDAVRVLQEKGDEIDLVVLDLNLPLMGGIEVAEYMRSHDSLRKTPILISTAQSLPQIIRVMQGGGDDYIDKPFSILQLKNRVEVLLQRKRATQGAVA